MAHFAALPAPVYAPRRAQTAPRKRAAVPLHRLLSVLHAVLVLLVQYCVVNTSPALAFVSQQAQSMQAKLLAEQQACCSNEELDCCQGRLHCCLEGFLSGAEVCPACGPSTCRGVGNAVCVWDLHQPVSCGLVEMPAMSPVFDQWILPSLHESSSSMAADYALWCAHASETLSHAECSQLLRCCGPACVDVDYGNVTCCTSAIDSMLPHGEQSPVPEAKYEKTEHGWIIGHHPLYTPADTAQLQELLVGLKHCFAYSMSQLHYLRAGICVFSQSCWPHISSSCLGVGQVCRFATYMQTFTHGIIHHPPCTLTISLLLVVRRSRCCRCWQQLHGAMCLIRLAAHMVACQLSLVLVVQRP